MVHRCSLRPIAFLHGLLLMAASAFITRRTPPRLVRRQHFFASSASSLSTPAVAAPTGDDVSALVSFLRGKRNVCVVTGAGVSTESGIPDYRGPLGSYKLGHKPMVHQDFVTKEAARKRYWARSMLGWATFSQAAPNDGHYALAVLESLGVVGMVVTQNVDRLHQKSGSVNVIDLHGRNDRVSCLSCGCNLARRQVQQQIDLLNPTFRERIDAEVTRIRAADAAAATEDDAATALRQARTLLNEVERRVIPDWTPGAVMRPPGTGTSTSTSAPTTTATPAAATAAPPATLLRADGDAELGMTDFTDFIVPSCPRCSTGVLKPDVVFFGDNVPVREMTMSMIFGPHAFRVSPRLFFPCSSGRAWTRRFKRSTPATVCSARPSRSTARSASRNGPAATASRSPSSTLVRRVRNGRSSPVWCTRVRATAPRCSKPPRKTCDMWRNLNKTPIVS